MNYDIHFWRSVHRSVNRCRMVNGHQKITLNQMLQCRGLRVLTESELRTAVREGRRMAKAAERLAWARRDPKVIATVRQLATTKAEMPN